MDIWSVQGLGSRVSGVGFWGLGLGVSDAIVAGSDYEVI